MNYFESKMLRAQDKYKQVEQATSAVRGNARMAFGGHMGRGVLHRAQGAVNKVTDAAGESVKRKLFYDLSLIDIHKPDFNHIAELESRLNLVKYLYDKDDYHFLYMEAWGTIIEKVRGFIEKYGTKTDKKLLLPKLQFSK